MKVPEPRKLKSGTWFIQMRLGGWKTDRIPREIYTHLADADIANQVDAIRAFYSQNAN